MDSASACMPCNLHDLHDLHPAWQMSCTLHVLLHGAGGSPPRPDALTPNCGAVSYSQSATMVSALLYCGREAAVAGLVSQYEVATDLHEQQRRRFECCIAAL